MVFQPGNPGGPGRPKRAETISDIIREALKQRTIGGKPIPGDRTVADVIAEVVMAKALKGDHKFITTLLERVEGKVKERHEISGPDGAPLFARDAQHRMLADSRAVELACQLDELLARPTDSDGLAGADPGGIRPPGQ